MDPDPSNRPASFSTATLPAWDGSLPLAVGFGMLAAFVGAILWATLVAATNVKIGFAAVGVGFLVGWAMRRAGHGRTPVFGYIAAVLSLLGCVVGDVLTDCVSVAQQHGQPALDVIGHLTPSIAVDRLQAGFQPLDALFYFLAVSAGYRNAFSPR